jgi:hypothetical protein
MGQVALQQLGLDHLPSSAQPPQALGQELLGFHFFRFSFLLVGIQ